MYLRVFHHFFKHFLAEPNRAYNFIAISVPQIQNFRKFGPKLRLLQAKNKLKQPNTANRPILAAPQPSRAELEHPQFWSDFSEILDLRSWNTFKTAVSVWLCLKKWWNTLMYISNGGKREIIALRDRIACQKRCNQPVVIRQDFHNMHLI